MVRCVGRLLCWLIVASALAACDKPSSTETSDRVSSTTTGSAATRQAGPGFTINAPRPATVTHVEAKDGAPAMDIHQFHQTTRESWQVHVIELDERQNFARTVAQMRDKIALTTPMKRDEAFPTTGDVAGADLRYVVDQDGQPQFARSLIVVRKPRVFHVRAVFPRGQAEREAAADRFIESFAFAP
jgi:hypothetical protein